MPDLATVRRCARAMDTVLEVSKVWPRVPHRLQLQESGKAKAQCGDGKRDCRIEEPAGKPASIAFE